ncbi:hypothetical protein BMS3Abin09_00224 [bacterium BMS3Abin09]|nr:hypothetical protein BMS3Abin09_00224 [bacterium BMS3Abin09]
MDLEPYPCAVVIGYKVRSFSGVGREKRRLDYTFIADPALTAGGLITFFSNELIDLFFLKLSVCLIDPYYLIIVIDDTERVSYAIKDRMKKLP